MRRSAILLALTAGVGCGPGVHDLTESNEPLLTLRGRIEGRPARAPQSPRVGLVWLRSTSNLDIYCFINDPRVPAFEGFVAGSSTVAEAGCPDPRGSQRLALGPSAALDPEAQTYALPLYALPAPEVLAGTFYARTGMAAVVLFDDVDGDGALGAAAACFTDDPPPEDRVLAVSSWQLGAEGQRLIYQEGPAVLAGATPALPLDCFLFPPGYSVLEHAPNVDEGVTCELEAFAAGIDLRYAAGQTLTAPLCEVRAPEILPPPPERPYDAEDNVLIECAAQDYLVVVDADCLCPERRVYTLVGFDEVDGVSIQWDLTEEPPGWWPCEPEP